MRGILKTILQFSVIVGLFTVISHLSAFAAPALELSSEYSKYNIPTPPNKSGQQIITDLVLGGLKYVKGITVVIGILYMSILGLRLIMASGNDEDITKAKNGLIYTIIALAIISMSQELSKVFDMSTSTILESPTEIVKRAQIFDKQIEVIITFIKYTLGAFATLMVVRSAISLITAGGDDEETSKQKKAILYSGAGLILINIGDIFINKVFYKIDKTAYSGTFGVQPGVDANEGVAQIAGITNFVVAFVGPIAVLMLIAGAIMYATAGGEDEQTDKAKRLITAAIIGIIIIFGAFAIVSTIISSELTQLGMITDE